MFTLMPFRNRFSVATLALAMVFVAALVHESKASALNQLEPIAAPYDDAGGDCTGEFSDPVGILFKGFRAGVTNVTKDTEFYTEHHPEGDWDWGENDSTQGLYVREGEQYVCHADNASRADHTEVDPSGRYHARYWFIPSSAGSSIKKTVATPHHEDFVTEEENSGCKGKWYVRVASELFPIIGEEVNGNHAVNATGSDGSGFDQGRRQLRMAFQDHGIPAMPENWGNDETFKQCTGVKAGSNGYGVIVTVEYAFNPRTLNPTKATASSAQLNGMMITEEAGTKGWFDWGPSSSQGQAGYSHKTAVQSIPGATDTSVSAQLTGLSPGTTYYVRMFGENQAGEVQEGEEVHFTTCGGSVNESQAPVDPRAVIACEGDADIFYRTPSGELGHDWSNVIVRNGWGNEALAASVAGKAHAVVDSKGGINVFFRTAAGGLGHEWWEASAHSWGYQVLPGEVAGEPMPVVEPGTNDVHVFYRTPSGLLGHEWFDMGNPSAGWGSQVLYFGVAGDPHPVIDWKGGINVFYRTPAGGLGHTWWEQSSESWGGEVLGGAVAGEPMPVVEPGTNDVHVFYRTPSGQLGHEWMDMAHPDYGWGAEVLPFELVSEPHPTIDTAGGINVFYRTPANGLGHTWWEQSIERWRGQVLPGEVSGEPDAAVEPGTNDVHVFYRTPSGQLGHEWMDMAHPDLGWGHEVLAGSVASTPMATIDWAGGINVFYRTAGGGLGHEWWEQSTERWGNEVLGGAVTSEPDAVVEPGTNDVHVFYKTPAEQLGHNWYDMGTHNGWGSETLKASVTSSVHPVVDSKGGFNAFFRTASGGLGHEWWEASIEQWRFQELPGAVASEPQAVVEPGTDDVHVFYRTPNGELGHEWMDMAHPDLGWGHEVLNDPVASDPRPTIDAAGGINVFYRTPTDGLGHAWWEGSTERWGNEILPGEVAGEPDAIVEPGTDDVHVFYRTPNGELGHEWMDMAHPDLGWGHELVSASVTSDPHAIVDSKGGINVFYRTAAGGLGHTWWEGSIERWRGEVLVGEVAGEPMPIVEPGTDDVHVFYRTPSGQIGHEWMDMANPTAGWGHEVFNDPIASNPSPIINKEGGINVVYRMPSGALGHAWWEQSSESWGNEALAGQIAPTLPLATTGSGIGVSASEVKVEGSINPEGELANYYFEYGPTTAYGSKTPATGNVPLGYSPFSVSQTLSGLTLGTTYHYRLVAETAEGTSRGADQTVVPKGQKATTEPATAIGATAATVNGVVNPEGVATSWYFEYGPTTAYGTKIPATTNPAGSGAGNVAVSETLSGLSPATTYHYRLVATSELGTVAGIDRTFATRTAPVAATRLEGLPLSESFNGSPASLSNFTARWARLGWADGASPEGSDTTEGWQPVDGAATVDGAYFTPIVADAGQGVASVVTMAKDPGAENGSFAIWLDLQNPGGTSRSGYQLKFLETGSGLFEVILSKWAAGTQTVLATKTNYAFANRGSLALVDEGVYVSAWTDAGSGFSEILSATDSSYHSGTSGLEGSGSNTRLNDFKTGQLVAPVANMNAALTTMAPITAPLNNFEFPLYDGGRFAPVVWATGAPEYKAGIVQNPGWGPLIENYPTINGAFWRTPIADDPGPGKAAIITVYAGPSSAPGYFSLLLDMPNPASSHAGYQLKFVKTGASVYEVSLAKLVGTQVNLTTSTNCSLPQGAQVALVEKAGTVSAWVKVGTAEFTQLLSANDSTFTNGYAGFDASGLGTRLVQFRIGVLKPF